MKHIFVFLVLIFICGMARSQKLAQIKKILDTTSNPIGYVKYVLKKKYFIDTIAVYSTNSFVGLADSLAYKGKIGKTYGPFKGENILVKILFKAPNTFYHVNHILLDTSTFTPKFADSLANVLMSKIKTGTSSFADQASVYSADIPSAIKGGDLGWFVQGVMLPQLDAQITKRKKGELFKVWSAAGLHIVKIVDNPKKDVGFALLLRVIL